MEQKKNKFSNWIRNSITARMLVVGVLLLVLLIPLSFVKDLITERSYRQKEVVNEINSKWGNEVILSGPILKIPYTIEKEEKSYNKKTESYFTTTKELSKFAYFFPEKLHIDSKVETKPLNRSIYKSVVYNSDIQVSGEFPIIDFSSEAVKPKSINWKKASIILQTSNLKGIRNTIEVQLGNQKLNMNPKYDTSSLNTIQSEAIPDIAENMLSPTPFSFTINVNGSESLQFIPIGKETSATMTSNWHSPSFNGLFLPEDGSRKITPSGFSASWKVLQINRQFEQAFFGYLPDLQEFSFGTKLIIPVDEYQKSERTAKYGFLVIGLTLLVFLMIQLVSKIYIHPFQYVMVGLALVMFYTLLISISEHSTFLKAYLIAAASVLILIGAYSRAILKGYKFPLLISVSLASLYGFIYIIIQLESYALLVGSIGLFAILAIIMFASRKIDWGNN